MAPVRATVKGLIRTIATHDVLTKRKGGQLQIEGGKNGAKHTGGTHIDAKLQLNHYKGILIKGL